MDTTNLYDIAINDINGDSVNLNDYKGKYILFVNVASKCGFTPQYKDLQELHNTYKDNLVVIGVPCNQFGGQEPGTGEEIKSFCSKNYGVEFLITEKVKVKGDQQHPLYSWLTKKEANGVKGSSVKWNFQKYLINPEGQLIDFFYSTTSPLSNKITKHIK
ncbi:MAG: glutathione peroxidase [Flavobacteriales bacterium]|nr:glutathione peroxidase [Flavobacteriales bacterium]